MIKLLTKQDFLDKTTLMSKQGTTNYWKNINYSINKRLQYHLAVVEILKSYRDNFDPNDILEIGSMGLQIVQDSDTLDQSNNRFSFSGKVSTYDLDISEVPINIKQYKIIIALRVLHWVPSERQRKTLLDLLSHSDIGIIIAVPRKSKKHINGMNYDDLVNIMGFHPIIYIPFKFTPVYFFNQKFQSDINLQNVIKLNAIYILPIQQYIVRIIRFFFRK